MTGQNWVMRFRSEELTKVKEEGKHEHTWPQYNAFRSNCHSLEGEKGSGSVRVSRCNDCLAVRLVHLDADDQETVQIVEDPNRKG